MSSDAGVLECEGQEKKYKHKSASANQVLCWLALRQTVHHSGKLKSRGGEDPAGRRKPQVHF